MRYLAVLILLTPALHAQSLDERIDRALPALIDTYKAFHAAPELSMREQNTAARLAAQLRELGYTVTERVGKYADPQETCYGIVAVLKNGEGPVVLVRTDMDALPVAEQTGLPFASNVRAKNATGEEVGVMHACGHDIHMTTLLGTAKVLADLRASWRGTLVLLGQPAEEVVQGASAMLGGGLYERFPRPAYLLAFHDWPAVPSGKIGYRAGYIMANSDSVNITVRGVGGHGAAPEKSKDPIVVAAQIVLALQTIVSRETSPFDSAVVTVGSIHGGAKRNIIPDDVKLLITVRTYKPDVRQRVLASIDRVAKGIAAAAGIPADREPIIEHVAPEATDAVFNDPPLTERVTKALARGMGVERIVEAEPSMVSEDFGRLGLDRKIPLLMLFLGAGDGTENQAGLHSSRFAPPPESTIRTGVKGMTLAVMELMGR